MSEGSSDGPRWRFFVDENIDPRVVDELAGYDIEAAWIPRTLVYGVDDVDDILPRCRETGAVLVTNNVRDFNATDLEPDDHAGIVVVHDKERPPEAIAEELHRITVAYGSREAFRGFESGDDDGLPRVLVESTGGSLPE